MSLFILLGRFPWGTVKGRSEKAEQEATGLVFLHPVEEETEDALEHTRKPLVCGLRGTVQ